MSEIHNDLATRTDLSSINAGPAAPAEPLEEQLLGTPAQGPEDETAREHDDATVVDLSPSSTSTANVSGDPSAEVPADMDAASALVGELVAQIGGNSSEATSAQAGVSAAATLKLTQP